MTAVDCRGVSFAYNGTQILEGVDLRVDAGEWVAIVGPNGAGKTTLLRIVSGMRPGSGEVLLGGDPVVAMNRSERARRVAVVPQTPVMPPELPLLEYVLMGRTPYISYWGSESAGDVEIARSVLAKVDLASMESRPLGSLSGGERQRAVLARALAQESPVLVLDEPTTGLDLGHQQRVLDHVDTLRKRQDLTVLSALHDLTLAAQYPDRVVLLDAGSVAAAGAPRDVLTTERLARHFGANVAVMNDEVGGLVVVPQRSRPSTDAVTLDEASPARYAMDPSTSDPTK